MQIITDVLSSSVQWLVLFSRGHVHCGPLQLAPRWFSGANLRHKTTSGSVFFLVRTSGCNSSQNVVATMATTSKVELDFRQTILLRVWGGRRD